MITTRATNMRLPVINVDFLCDKFEFKCDKCRHTCDDHVFTRVSSATKHALVTCYKRNVEFNELQVTYVTQDHSAMVCSLEIETLNMWNISLVENLTNMSRE